MMGGSRLIYRTIREFKLYGGFSKKGNPVIIIGNGEATISLVKELAKSDEFYVLGLLDEDVSIHHREILGIRVLGNISILPEIINRFGISPVIIAMPSLLQQERRKVLDFSSKLKLKVMTVPAMGDLVSGRLNISKIRRVEVEDLLGRDVVDLDNSGLKQLIHKQAVLVSGAGGSIGSELCRQIIKFNPKYLICFDISECALYQLEQELILQDISVNLVYLIGDVKHEARVDKLLSQYKPKVVFHAAAYKHVPLMEVDNVSEAFNNNVLGTYTLAKACKKAKVNKFIMVSTDKAVNPTNVMGASKRLAEMVCQGLQDKNGTLFMIVRFGNVLGSSGSVIPKFREQIKAGGPITVTHPEITRYFMTIPEACRLVLEAGCMGTGGEIFIFDMGKSVKIVDLAKKMIRLAGLIPNQDIQIHFSGLRPGEKLFEELLNDKETTMPTHHPKIMIGNVRTYQFEEVQLQITALLQVAKTNNDRLVVLNMKKIVPEFKSKNSVYERLDAEV
jgi:FlaA1/EpsC-like NDP-sugar epimerase